jgi:hypothetical protein
MLSNKKVMPSVVTTVWDSITQNERYNQVIDVLTATNAQLTELSMKNIREDQQDSTLCDVWTWSGTWI